MKMRMKEMKVRWWWKWGESYSTRTRSGERKRRGKEQTPTPTHLARSGPTLKGQEKRKAEADGHGTRPAEGGKGRKRLNQPNKAKTYAYLGTRRTRPTWGKNAWNWESKTELKFTARTQFKSRESCVIPERDRNQIQPYGHKQLFKFQRIRCTKV